MNRQYSLLRHTYVILLLAVVSFVVWFADSTRADWPGLLGPSRNGHADSKSEIPEKLATDPKQIWKVEAGQGFAGPAVAGNDFVLFERVGDSDRVRLLNAATGEEVWHRNLKANYRGGVNPDLGPRAVPAILEASILVYSAAGDLTLLNRKDGSVHWTRSLRKEYEADDGYFGAGSTPLVVEDRAIVNVGGKLGSVVCVSLFDGKTMWTSMPADASYASPILIQLTQGNSASQIVVVPTRYKTLGLALDTGKLAWDFPFGQRGPTVNAATPVVTASGDLFLTASYGIGSVLVRADTASVKMIIKGSEISSQYATPVVLSGKIFGSDGREDEGTGAYKCLKSDDGKLLWARSDMPVCHTIAAAKKLLVLGIDGQIWALDSTSSQFSPLWKSSLPKGLYRALPAFTGNRLYTRSSSGNVDAWYCFELAS